MHERLRLKIRDERGHARLTPALVERLLAGLAAARVPAFVTLESDGDAFCEGMDLDQLAVADTEDVAAALDRFAALLGAIGTVPVPVVALVGGPAMGGGVGLAAAADLVLATPRATFGLPEALFGLMPAMVFPVLARRVGPARARWLALGAPTISAAEAWRLGLVDEVVDDLEGALARRARRLERLDPRAVAEIKSLAALYDTTPAALHPHAAARFTQLLKSEETQGRIARFIDGGTPWPEEDRS